MAKRAGAADEDDNGGAYAYPRSFVKETLRMSMAFPHARAGSSSSSDHHHAELQDSHQPHLCLHSRKAFAAHLQQFCDKHQISGRLRVAKDGLNGCLGGSKANLRLFTDAFSRACFDGKKYLDEDEHDEETGDAVIDRNRNRTFDDIHWKWGGLVQKYDVADGVEREDSERVRATDQKMTGPTAVRLCDEVVSLFGNCYRSLNTTELQHHDVHDNTKRGAAAAQDGTDAWLRYYRKLFDSDACRAALYHRGPADTGPERSPLGDTERSDDTALHHCLLPATHLSPEEWKRRLESSKPEDVVFFDARNCYETAIGGFECDAEFDDKKNKLPVHTRQFTDVPRILAENREAIRRQCAGKQVFAYCTGGVRCERATQLLKIVLNNNSDEGEEAKAVYQLDGGIHSFLSRYPDGGGLFRGKNFVFDNRMVEDKFGDAVVGKCVLCQTPWDDYRLGARCAECRMRVRIADASSTPRQPAGLLRERQQRKKPYAYGGWEVDPQQAARSPPAGKQEQQQEQHHGHGGQNQKAWYRWSHEDKLHLHERTGFHLLHSRIRHCFFTASRLASSLPARIVFCDEPFDPYRLLGVQKSAGADEIRRAYKKLAVRHHPDKGGDPEEFKKINRAYEILSDPKQKRQYDSFGAGGNPFEASGAGAGAPGGAGGFGGGAPGGGPFGGFGHGPGGFEGFGGGGNANGSGVFGDDPFAAFARMGFEEFAQGQTQRRHQQVASPRPILRVLPVTLEQICAHQTGGAKNKTEVTFEKQAVCSSCHGVGGEFEVCRTCGGSGYEIRTRQLGPGSYVQTQGTCSSCRGAGRRLLHVCKKCNGRAVFPKVEGRCAVVLDPGVVEEGYTFRFPGVGSEVFDPGTGQVLKGDVLVVVSLQPTLGRSSSPTSSSEKALRYERLPFERGPGRALYTKLSLPFADAVCGGVQLEVKHPCGSYFTVNVPPLSRHTDVLRVVGCGMLWNRGAAATRAGAEQSANAGDLFIKLQVPAHPNAGAQNTRGNGVSSKTSTPLWKTDEEREALRKVLAGERGVLDGVSPEEGKRWLDRRRQVMVERGAGGCGRRKVILQCKPRRQQRDGLVDCIK
eukprot:g15048.t1